MDRIKPAVGNNIHQVTPGTPQALSPAPGTALAEVPGQFDYVNTKVVPLRPDHLERNRIVAYNKNSNMNGPIDLLRTQVLRYWWTSTCAGPRSAATWACPWSRH